MVPLDGDRGHHVHSFFRYFVHTNLSADKVHYSKFNIFVPMHALRLEGSVTKLYIQFNSIQFSLFPAHINISYNIDNVHILCRKRGGLTTVLMNVHPLTLNVVNYEHNYYCL